jgi:ubiquinone/menaquinone biosynthesis C-methylase UbiE
MGRTGGEIGGSAARRWRDALDAWRIPPDILAGSSTSPWVLPVKIFAGRAHQQLDSPSGRSYEIAVEAVPIGGSVLDVGAGAGAASLALRGRAGSITAVDEDAEMLAIVADLAAGAGVDAATVGGRWPDINAAVPPADVVVCHHVLYNVADLDAFITALTAHARRRVVVEITAFHPASLLNPLWMMLHGLERPTGPTAAEAIAVIAATGVEPRSVEWHRPISRDGTSYHELVTSTCVRLCLGPQRRDDVEAALRELGVREDRPYLGPPSRDVVTIWWDI